MLARQVMMGGPTSTHSEGGMRIKDSRRLWFLGVVAFFAFLGLVFAVKHFVLDALLDALMTPSR